MADVVNVKQGCWNRIGSPALWRVLLCNLLLLTASCASPVPVLPPVAAYSADFDLGSQGFAFYQEFYGSRAYLNAEVAHGLQKGMMNGVTFWPPVETGMANLAGGRPRGLMLLLPAAGVVSKMPDEAILGHRNDFNNLAANHPAMEFIWSLMPEWDQSGGGWVSGGRPVYRSLSKIQAYERFVGYYQNNYPALMNYLRQPRTERRYALAAVTDYAPNAFYCYEMGVDLCILERGNDELGDLSTGIAFQRGAARQYGRRWGIDLSSWRTSNNSATLYDPPGLLRGGWSASYLRRHYYAAFMSGANIIHNEAANYLYRDGTLNPFGEAAQEFADFSLRRHPDVGRPSVSTAVLMDHFSGFDPKHGVYNQANAVWYQDIPYAAGDFMVNNFFRAAFPNHWLHGLAPGAAFANGSGIPDAARFQSFLAAGGDPRPYEPMPFTRWGDALDVITTAVRADTLRAYKTIMLLGAVNLDVRLKNDLREWVEQGGTLLLNVAQVKPEDADLAGVTIVGSQRTGSSSRWIDTGVAQTELQYDYTLVRPSTATVVAANQLGDPLVTRNALGGGEVLLSTPLYLQSNSRDELLGVGLQLLDSVVLRNAAARVTGPPVAYSVNQASGKTVVAIINNSGGEWSGEISVPRSRATPRVREYITEQPANFNQSANEWTISARVPAYDLRIFAVEQTTASNTTREPGTNRQRK